MPYIVEYFRDAEWKREGSTRDPDEWMRLMQSALDIEGTRYRIRAGDKTVLETTLRRNG